MSGLDEGAGREFTGGPGGGVAVQRPRRLLHADACAGGAAPPIPHAEITLLGGRWHADFLSGRPDPVDRVLVVPRAEGLAGQPAGAPPEDALPRFLADARPYRYDLAVQLHGGGAASNPLLKALGARRSIGLRAEGAAALDATVPYRYYQSEVFRFLEVVALVGAQGPPGREENRGGEG
jgi:ADP-heptose:LPS heptosyltransferase